MKRLMVHMHETGGLLPEDGVRFHMSSMARLVAWGWVREEPFEGSPSAFFLTDKGKAAFPWPYQAG